MLPLCHRGPPYNEITYHLFHCSPLLTRPKDNNERRVILDLSFPKGNLLNDQVSKNLFDGTEFQLKLPLVDHCGLAGNILV